MRDGSRTDFALPVRHGWEPLETDDHKGAEVDGIQRVERLARQPDTTRYAGPSALSFGVFVLALFFSRACLLGGC